LEDPRLFPLVLEASDFEDLLVFGDAAAKYSSAVPKAMEDRLFSLDLEASDLDDLGFGDAAFASYSSHLDLNDLVEDREIFSLETDLEDLEFDCFLLDSAGFEVTSALEDRGWCVFSDLNDVCFAPSRWKPARLAVRGDIVVSCND
jgi:hypothetical protein